MSTNISSTQEIDIPDMGYAMKFLICLLGEESRLLLLIFLLGDKSKLLLLVYR